MLYRKGIQWQQSAKFPWRPISRVFIYEDGKRNATMTADRTGALRVTTVTASK